MARSRLVKLANEIDACRRCPLYRDATQGVAGEGRLKARLMLVGEQPGDREDLTGHPFVGPAGRILDQALAEAGLERAEVFITNAVKHFKHVQTGSRRKGLTPKADEIAACRIWLERELDVVKPDTIIALGATAARALLHRVVKIGAERGRPIETEAGARLFITVHPSSLLRSRAAGDYATQYRRFVRDLRRAAGQ